MILYHTSNSRLRQLEQAQFDAMDEQGEEIGDRTNGTQGNNDANDPDDRERIYEQVSIIVQSYISWYFMILM